MSADFVLHTEALTVGYNGKPLISDIEIGVNRGEIMTLIGPNGAGKSTILKSLTRQLALVGGTVYLGKRSLADMPEKQLSRTLSLVLTERIRPELMTCFDVVASGRYPYTGWLGLLGEHDREVVRQSMQYVHAEELSELDFNCISDGQRQRVLLARALCQQPDIIVLDEPTSFLDIRHKLELLSLLKRLALEQGLTVVMSLHELDLAQKISDIVVCVHERHIERCGPPEEVFTADYIHRLYDVQGGSYNAAFGSLEFSAAQGEPKVFVIGGGGAGIPRYRSLNRAGIPFAAGVLQSSDLDYPVAKALASRVIEEDAFALVSDARVRQAMDVLRSCERAYCPLMQFGATNAGNRALLDEARRLGILQKE